MPSVRGDKPVRILLWGLAASRTPGGGRRYVEGLVEGITAAGCEVYLCAASDGHLESGDAQVHRVDAPSGYRRIGWEFRNLGRIADEIQADVVHFPHEWVPPSPIPVVSTLQNVAWVHPHTRRYRRVRGAAYRRLCKATIPSAAGIVAVSGRTADLFANLLPGIAAAIDVIPEGAQIDACTARRAPPRAEVLLVTGRAAYKNTAMAVGAYEAAVDSGFRSPLTVVGLAHSERISTNSSYLGWISHQALLDRMREATLVLFPSRVESFGLPALEAVGVGCPVLVSEGTPMSDVLGNLCVAVEPSVKAWSDAMLSVDWNLQRTRLAGTETRATLKSKYAWSAVGEATMAVYEKALATPRKD